MLAWKVRVNYSHNTEFFYLKSVCTFKVSDNSLPYFDGSCFTECSVVTRYCSNKDNLNVCRYLYNKHFGSNNGLESECHNDVFKEEFFILFLTFSHYKNNELSVNLNTVFKTGMIHCGAIVINGLIFTIDDSGIHLANSSLFLGFKNHKLITLAFGLSSQNIERVCYSFTVYGGLVFFFFKHFRFIFFGFLKSNSTYVNLFVFLLGAYSNLKNFGALSLKINELSLVDFLGLERVFELNAFSPKCVIKRKYEWVNKMPKCFVSFILCVASLSCFLEIVAVFSYSLATLFIAFIHTFLVVLYTACLFSLNFIFYSYQVKPFEKFQPTNIICRSINVCTLSCDLGLPQRRRKKTIGLMLRLIFSYVFCFLKILYKAFFDEMTSYRFYVNPYFFSKKNKRRMPYYSSWFINFDSVNIFITTLSTSFDYKMSKLYVNGSFVKTVYDARVFYGVMWLKVFTPEAIHDSYDDKTNDGSYQSDYEADHEYDDVTDSKGSKRAHFTIISHILRSVLSWILAVAFIGLMLSCVDMNLAIMFMYANYLIIFNVCVLYVFMFLVNMLIYSGLWLIKLTVSSSQNLAICVIAFFIASFLGSIEELSIYKFECFFVYAAALIVDKFFSFSINPLFNFFMTLVGYRSVSFEPLTSYFKVLARQLNAYDVNVRRISWADFLPTDVYCSSYAYCFLPTMAYMWVLAWLMKGFIYSAILMFFAYCCVVIVFFVWVRASGDHMNVASTFKYYEKYLITYPIALVKYITIPIFGLTAFSVFILMFSLLNRSHFYAFLTCLKWKSRTYYWFAFFKEKKLSKMSKAAENKNTFSYSYILKRGRKGNNVDDLAYWRPKWFKSMARDLEWMAMSFDRGRLKDNSALWEQPIRSLLRKPQHFYEFKDYHYHCINRPFKVLSFWECYFYYLSWKKYFRLTDFKHRVNFVTSEYNISLWDYDYLNRHSYWHQVPDHLFYRYYKRFSSSYFDKHFRVGFIYFKDLQPGERNDMDIFYSLSEKRKRNIMPRRFDDFLSHIGKTLHRTWVDKTNILSTDNKYSFKFVESEAQETPKNFLKKDKEPKTLSIHDYNTIDIWGNWKKLVVWFNKRRVRYRQFRSLRPISMREYFLSPIIVLESMPKYVEPYRWVNYIKKELLFLLDHVRVFTFFEEYYFKYNDGSEYTCTKKPSEKYASNGGQFFNETSFHKNWLMLEYVALLNTSLSYYSLPALYNGQFCPKQFKLNIANNLNVQKKNFLHDVGGSLPSYSVIIPSNKLVRIMFDSDYDWYYELPNVSLMRDVSRFDRIFNKDLCNFTGSDDVYWRTLNRHIRSSKIYSTNGATLKKYSGEVFLDPTVKLRLLSDEVGFDGYDLGYFKSLNAYNNSVFNPGKKVFFVSSNMKKRFKSTWKFLHPLVKNK